MNFEDLENTGYLEDIFDSLKRWNDLPKKVREKFKSIDEYDNFQRNMEQW